MYIDVNYPESKKAFYDFLYNQIKLYTQDETDGTAVLANASAVLKIAFSKSNWVGFYLKDSAKSELTLGPFQGKPAVTRIPYGQGVCGKAWERGEAIVVKDVKCFKGHITCDCDTLSEIVIPLYKGGDFYGVLDMDSAVPSYFTDADRDGLTRCSELFLKAAPDDKGAIR